MFSHPTDVPEETATPSEHKHLDWSSCQALSVSQCLTGHAVLIVVSARSHQLSHSTSPAEERRGGPNNLPVLKRSSGPPGFPASSSRQLGFSKTSDLSPLQKT